LGFNLKNTFIICHFLEAGDGVLCIICPFLEAGEGVLCIICHFLEAGDGVLCIIWHFLEAGDGELYRTFCAQSHVNSFLKPYLPLGMPELRSSNRKTIACRLL